MATELTESTEGSDDKYLQAILRLHKLTAENKIQWQALADAQSVRPISRDTAGSVGALSALIANSSLGRIEVYIQTFRATYGAGTYELQKETEHYYMPVSPFKQSANNDSAVVKYTLEIVEGKKVLFRFPDYRDVMKNLWSTVEKQVTKNKVEAAFDSLLQEEDDADSVVN